MESLERLLDDGRVLVVYPLLWGMGRVGIGPPDDRGCDDVWCFPTLARAVQAWATWDGVGEPEGWHRHPASGQRQRAWDQR